MPRRATTSPLPSCTAATGSVPAADGFLGLRRAAAFHERLPRDVTLPSRGKSCAPSRPDRHYHEKGIGKRDAWKSDSQPPERLVNCLAFSPNEKALATGSEDGTALLWDLSGMRRAESRGGTS
jgi:hypothetical protein